MKNNKDNFVYVRHIRDAIEKIIAYISNHTQQDFDENEWDQAAIIRHLEILGEASSKIDTSFRQKYSHIEWRRIIDLRNVLIHDYMSVDIDIVWRIINDDVPKFRKQIIELLKEEEG